MRLIFFFFQSHAARAMLLDRLIRSLVRSVPRPPLFERVEEPCASVPSSTRENQRGRRSQQKPSLFLQQLQNTRSLSSL